MFVRCDVTKEQDIRALVDSTIGEFDQLDCIVNNAGWHPPAMAIDDISIEDFEKLLRLNLTSTFAGCKFAVPHLRKTKGSIINMSSEAAIIGQGAAAAYASTKGGAVRTDSRTGIRFGPGRCSRQRSVSCRCDDTVNKGVGRYAVRPCCGAEDGG